jgi:hypothetical protein
MGASAKRGDRGQGLGVGLKKDRKEISPAAAGGTDKRPINPVFLTGMYAQLKSALVLAPRLPEGNELVLSRMSRNRP